MESRNTVLTRGEDLDKVEANLREAMALLETQRNRTDRNDPAGRHLSIAITAIEDALLRVREAR